jgi:serine protease Do
MATGFAYDDRGLVVTNATAVVGCRDIRVYSAQHREARAQLVGVDLLTGVGLLRVPRGFAPPLPRAPAAEAREGAFVFTVGYAQGPAPSHASGRITWRYDAAPRGLLQMTNPVVPGNAGGAAVDREGRLVGLIVGELGKLEAGDDALFEAERRGRSFAMPVDHLEPLVAELERYGKSPRGYLGVRIEQGRVLDPERPGDPFEVGVAITEVFPDGPAWRAGLRAGDLVVAVDGEPMSGPEQLMQEVQRRHAGDALQLVWVRDELRHEARVWLGAPPDSLLLSIFESVRAAARTRALEVPPESER